MPQRRRGIAARSTLADVIERTFREIGFASPCVASELALRNIVEQRS